MPGMTRHPVLRFFSFLDSLPAVFLARVLKSDGMTFTLSPATPPILVLSSLAVSLPVLSLLAVSLSNGQTVDGPPISINQINLS
jgi:hypothetical protein